MGKDGDLIFFFCLVIHAHEIQLHGHRQVDIVLFKQILLDEVKKQEGCWPHLKLNHSSQTLRLQTLFHFFFFFAYQDSSPRLFAEPACLSLSNQALHVTAFRAINASVLSAFTAGSGHQLSQLFSKPSRLTGPLNNLLTYLNTCIYIGGFVLYMLVRLHDHQLDDKLQIAYDYSFTNLFIYFL